MAVTFVAAGALATSATQADIDVIAPTLQADDIMIACVANMQLANAISPPDGTWTQIIQEENDCTNATHDHIYAIWWKLATGADSGATFNFTKATDDNQLFCGVISAWRGCDPSAPIDTTPVDRTETVGATDNVSFPAFDPTSTEAHVVYTAFYAQNLTTFAAAMSGDTNPDCTTRFDLETGVGDNFTIACTSGDNDGSAIASRTWASNATADAANTGVVFALKPPSQDQHLGFRRRFTAGLALVLLAWQPFTPAQPQPPPQSAAIIYRSNLPATDDFNRANEVPLAGNWTTAGPNPLSIFNNRVNPIGTSPTDPPGYCAAYWNADVFPADQYAQCEISNTAGGGGPCVRIAPDTALSCYAAEVEARGAGASTLRLKKFVNNTLTTLATYSSLTVFADDLIKLTVFGSTLRTYINGIEIGAPVVDTDLTSGAAGIGGGNNDVLLDNWEAGVESPPSDNPPPRDRRILNRVIGGWWKPILYGTSGDAAPAAEEVAKPPRQDYGRDRILSTWIAPRPIQQRRPAVVQLVAPPPIIGSKPVQIRDTIVDSWPVLAALPQLGTRSAAIIPVAEVADDPPFSSRSPLPRILSAWQPGPGLPSRPPQLVQLAPVPVHDPPFDSRRTPFTPIYAAWKWRPVGAGDSAPVVVEPPPVLERQNLDAVYAGWRAPVQAPPRPRAVATLPGISVDNPPFARKPELRPALSAWQPLPEQIIYALRLVFAYQPDDPPFDQRRARLGPILSSWQRGAHAFHRAVAIAAIASSVVAEAPPSLDVAARASLVSTAWESAPAAIQRGPRLSPGVPGFSVDPPPPAAKSLLASVRAAREPAPPAPQVGAHLPVSVTAVPVNDPPFGLRQPMGPILSAWIPGPPKPHQPKYLGQPFIASDVNDPPFALRQWRSGILAAWIPGPPAPQWGAHVPVSVSAVPVHDPPFWLRQPLWPIVASWIPGPPLPYRPEYIVQPSAAAADNPPFAIRPWLSTALAAWQPGPPAAQRATRTPQEAAQAEQPAAASRPWLHAILGTWEPPSPAAQRAPHTPQEAAPAEQTPYRSRSWLSAALGAWEAPSPAVQRAPRLSPGVPGFSVDPPPPAAKSLLASLRAAWEPSPLIVLPPRLAQPERVDDPPFGLRAPIWPVLTAWLPAPPKPQVGTDVPVSVSAVPVHDPPFGIRPWLPTITALWVPGPPHPILRAVVATESGPLTITALFAGPVTLIPAGGGIVTLDAAGATEITFFTTGRAGPVSREA